MVHVLHSVLHAHVCAQCGYLDISVDRIFQCLESLHIGKRTFLSSSLNPNPRLLDGYQPLLSCMLYSMHMEHRWLWAYRDPTTVWWCSACSEEFSPTGTPATDVLRKGLEDLHGLCDHVLHTFQVDIPS